MEASCCPIKYDCRHNSTVSEIAEKHENHEKNAIAKGKHRVNGICYSLEKGNQLITLKSIFCVLLKFALKTASIMRKENAYQLTRRGHVKCAIASKVIESAQRRSVHL
jgi:hypothetical protein